MIKYLKPVRMDVGGQVPTSPAPSPTPSPTPTEPPKPIEGDV